MENLVSNIIKLELEEIESYDFPLDEVFGLEIIYKDVKFCLIINLSSLNKNLICCASGMQHRDKKNSKGILILPPFFDRWSWFKYFDESFIAYADPIFFKDDEIKLGWYVGDKNQWYVETFSIIIEKIAINQNINLDNILFYGSSGGGFASIGMGTLLKGSKVLVNNSQFTIMNYYESYTNNLVRVLKNEFPDLSESEILKNLDYRLNTVKLFEKKNYIPPITYYVNVESSPDLIRHCFPFIKDIRVLDFYNDEITIHFYKEIKDTPHSPMSIEKSVSLIKSFAKENLYNGVE